MPLARTNAIAVPADPIGETTMLHYAAVFFVIAIVAAVLGFGGLAAGAAGIAKILFFIFLLGAIASLIIGGFNRAGRA
jgi:uncharacterized membrane protein YtjA (UPF0391 family)